MFGRRPSPWNESTPDDELVGWTQRGQRDAFGILYDRYLTGVYGYCHRLLGDREAAQDVNSTVFIKALANLAGYRTGNKPGSFRSWLFTIAHNAIADELRSRRGTASLDDAAWIADPAPSLEEQALRADQRQRVTDLLPRLSPDQAEVIALRMSGLNAAEIGAVLGRPRNAIDGIHHRALLRLQALVADGAAVSTSGGNGRG